MKRCPQCGKQYSTEANFCPIDAGRLEEVPDDAPAERDDQVLGGRFAIGEHLGDGGKTGQVFEGTDKQTGERCVIKWVDRDVFSSALQMQRTERELKQLERATAPGIGRILGHGRKGDRLWFATEYVSGRSLEAIVESEGPLPVERAAALVHSVGTALAEAAKLGVIHRDVAPKNVLVDADDQIKVINFGVAFPATPSVRGVPEYVAPEQVDGKPVDQRSNIYSLGAIYFYLITGRPPFEGDPQAVHSAHLHSPPPRASELADVPAEVDKLIDRALAKQSSKRYMTLRQLLGELEKVAGVEPSTTAQMAAARREPDAAAQTMLGVGALSSEGYVAPRTPAAAVADLAPPVSGRSPSGGFADVDDEARTNKLAVVSSADAASTSGEIGSGDEPAASEPAPKNGEPVRDDRPLPVAGEIGGGAPSTGNGKAAPAGEDEDDDDDDDDFDSRATQQSRKESESSKRKKRKRRRKRRRSRRPPVDEKFRDTMWFKKGEDGEGDADAEDAEERYADDGSLTGEDEERLSLRARESSGVAAAIDRREDASGKALVDEVSSNRMLIIAGGVFAVIVVVVVIAVMAMG